MPEFPEVNKQVAYLRSHCRGLVIERAQASKRCHLFAGLSRATRSRLLREFFVSARITDVHQRGKLVVFTTSRGVMVTHLMYSGRWSLREEAFTSNYKHHQKPPTERSLLLTLTSDDGRQLRFFDPQRLAALRLYPGAVLDAVSELQALGPEAVKTRLAPPGTPIWTARHFLHAASTSRQAISDHLLDQNKVAGLGRRYVAEALARAGLRPQRRAQSLSRAELSALHTCVCSLLRRAIATDLDYERVFTSKP